MKGKAPKKVTEYPLSRLGWDGRTSLGTALGLSAPSFLTASGTSCWFSGWRTCWRLQLCPCHTALPHAVRKQAKDAKTAAA